VTTRLAFYRGRKSDNSHAMVGDWLICWVTKSPYSHVELLENSGPAPAGTSVDFKPYTGPMATMLSSSIRDSGVRSAWRTLVPERWVVVEFDDDSEGAIEYVRSRIGRPYGWFDLLSFLLPWRVSWSGSDFCSEVIAAAFRLARAWRQSPGHLFDWAMTRPGARIIPDDELVIPWSAVNG
jgi:hypothetical protein